MLDKTSGQLNKPSMKLPEASLDAIHSYDWLGNVRELENAMERAVILCDEGSIAPDLLAIDHKPGLAAENSHMSPTDAKLSLEDSISLYWGIR